MTPTRHTARIGLALVLLPLAACSQMTQPQDIAVAQELCATRGGFAHVARYQHGKNLLINCKDGTHIDVRLSDAAMAKGER